jgi:hypothetical protein
MAKYQPENNVALMWRERKSAIGEMAWRNGVSSAPVGA